MHNKALKQGRADARRLAWRYVNTAGNEDVYKILD